MTATIERSKYFMAKSFRKTRYEWTVKPRLELDKHYGMYLNIPFCKSFCSFCPFYKTRYREGVAAEYVDRLIHEIKNTELPGPPEWIYFGGGTPNTLTASQIGSVVEAIKGKVGFPDAGIELMPGLVNEAYMDELAGMGFKKVSLGVESLDTEVGSMAKRNTVECSQLGNVIEWAKTRNLFVNIDLIAGLQKQTAESFWKDLEYLIPMKPSQITIYPYMVVRGFNVQPGFPTEQQFELIENAWERLSGLGYKRLSPWTFAFQKGEYDCSKAELVTDYIGFGAGSFSTNKKWKIVNPPVEYYIENVQSEGFKALIAGKESSADQWRKFGKMLSDLNIRIDKNFSRGINAYILWLRLNGYIQRGELTEKGILLAHHLMKTIVESLPFPLLDHSQISNAGQFLVETKRKAKKSISGFAESA